MRQLNKVGAMLETLAENQARYAENQARYDEKLIEVRTEPRREAGLLRSEIMRVERG